MDKLIIGTLLTTAASIFALIYTKYIERREILRTHQRDKRSKDYELLISNITASSAILREIAQNTENLASSMTLEAVDDATVEMDVEVTHLLERSRAQLNGMITWASNEVVHRYIQYQDTIKVLDKRAGINDEKNAKKYIETLNKNTGHLVLAIRKDLGYSDGVFSGSYGPIRLGEAIYMHSPEAKKYGKPEVKTKEVFESREKPAIEMPR